MGGGIKSHLPPKMFEAETSGQTMEHEIPALGSCLGSTRGQPQGGHIPHLQRMETLAQPLMLEGNLFTGLCFKTQLSFMVGKESVKRQNIAQTNGSNFGAID